MLKTINKRAFFISLIIGLLFSLAMCIGYAADKTGELMVGNTGWFACILCICILSTAVFYFFLIWTDKPAKIKSGKSKTAWLNHKFGFAITWIIIIVCWIPVFLAEYPGFFVYDATEEYLEVATRTFTTHHPLAHVLLLGGSVCGGNKLFGDYNYGIAIYTLFQMLVVSGIFAWTIKKINKYYWPILLWYGCFPTVVMFALCSAKDTLFAAFMMAAVILTVRYLKEEKFESCKSFFKNNIFLILCLIAMLLMRRNGVYGFIVFAVVLIIAVFKTSKKRAFACGLTGALLIISLVGYKTIDVGLAKATKAENIESQEILTVPIQQLARTWKVYKDEMSEEELNTLYSFLPPEALNRYTPNLSDPVKVDFNNTTFKTDKAKFMKLWWSLFVKHPLSYINAWIDTSYGFYYPFTVVNVYGGHEVYTFTYTESSYFGYEVEQPGMRISLLPGIDRLYRWISLDDDIQKLPIVSLFFSMGALFWVTIFCLAAMIYIKKYVYVVSFSLPVAVWLTLLLGPTFLPRYTVFLWFLLPYILSVTFSEIKYNKETKQEQK